MLQALFALISRFVQLFNKKRPVPPGPDPALNQFLVDIDAATRAAYNTRELVAHFRCYRESTAFPGGSATTLVAFFGTPDDPVAAERLAMQMHTVIAGTHVDKAVRWPDNTAVRIPALTRDTSVG